MQEKVEQMVQKMSAMFERPMDAVQVIDEIILPMKGEIVESEFWKSVKYKLFVLSSSDKKEQPFVAAFNGFQVNVFENQLQQKGKGMLLLHPEDHKTFIAAHKKNNIPEKS